MKKILKPLLTVSIIIGIQTILYWAVKYIVENPFLITSSFDSFIPFNKYFIYPYVSWYVMLFLIPLILYITDEKTYDRYIFSFIISLLISLSTFMLFPTVMERPEIIGNDLTSYLLNLIYSFDTPAYNCLPSIHCIACYLFIFSAVLNRKLKVIYKILIASISILIIISTLFTKQHAIYDVLGAFIVSIITWIIAIIAQNKTKKNINKSS